MSRVRFVLLRETISRKLKSWPAMCEKKRDSNSNPGLYNSEFTRKNIPMQISSNRSTREAQLRL